MSEHEIDPFLDDIAAELKRPVRFDSSFEARVMASLDPSALSLSDERMKASTPWLLRPRTFYVSPLAGLAVAAGLVAIITMSVLRTNPSSTVAVAPPKEDEFVLPGPITNVAAVPTVYAAPFTYIDRSAKTVALVGSFNDWDATKNVLTQTSDSVWSTNVMLAPGRYEYQLVVDGKWIADPSAQRSAGSDFGPANSVMIVSPVPR
ncbi:MAG TPA: isoamylase early set domain-containing protein [Gemmatimonadaceae bacterium]|nr:isoamylase early set domain-containing protein [Gemmatimonadaceae bacterium]